MIKFCPLAKKGHVWKQSGVTKEGAKEEEVGTLFFGNDKNNVIASTTWARDTNTV